MKKNLIHNSIGICLILASSCQDVQTFFQKTEKQLKTIHVTTTETVKSRTHLTAGNKVFWDSWDMIGVFSDTQPDPAPFKYVSSTDNNAKFTAQDNTVQGNTFYAVYPYDESSTTQGSIVTIELPGNQNYYPKSFDPFHCPMVAQSTDGNFRFMQTTGVIRLNLSGSIQIDRITLQGNNNENLYGPGTVDISSSDPTFSINDGITTPTLSMHLSGLRLSTEQETSFHFIVPVQTYPKGMTFNITGTRNDGTYVELTKRTERSITVTRSMINSFTGVDIDEELSMDEQSEREALIALYNATGGDNWANHTNWCTAKPLSEWYGVTYYNDKVQSINLPWNNLQGEIPDKFFNLSDLTHLNFEGNSLTGNLPPEIAKWENLRFLGLSNNNFTGSIPASFAKLVNLTYFSINENKLTGEIPKELESMPNWSSVIKDRLEPQLPGYGFTYPTTVEMIPLGNNLYLHPEGYALELRTGSNKLLSIDEIKETLKYCYTKFQDNFDFFHIVQNVLKPNEVGMSIAAEFAIINNTGIEGIGAYPMNNSSEYGSGGKLKGFIVSYSHNGLGAIIHEICHYWGAMDLEQETISNSGEGYREYAHWGISDVNGLLGGFDGSTLERNVDGNPKKYRATSSIGAQDGTFTPIASSNQYYAPLELYMMGLIPKEEVPDIRIFKDVWGTADENPNTNGIFYANSEEILTIDDIVTKYGERIPSYKDSQKSFRMCTIVVTANPVNDKEWQNIIENQTLIESEKGHDGTISFKEATGGRASLKITDINEELL